MSSMCLVDWTRLDRGGLVGVCVIELPSGLRISEIKVFVTPNGRWCQLPSELMRDADGQPLKSDNGKPRWRSLVRWRSRDLQERWSTALLAMIEAQHGPLGGGT